MNETISQIIKDNFKRFVLAVFAGLRTMKFSFIAASGVEAPRLVIAFTVIHENTFAAIALAFMNAFAASEAWETYLLYPKKWLLLFLNLFSLTVNIIIIAPVLMYTIKYNSTAVKLTDISADDFLISIYSIATTISTFLPLIVLAAVHAVRIDEGKHQEPMINPIHIPSPTTEGRQLIITNDNLNVEPVDTITEEQPLEFESTEAPTEESLILTSLENYGKTVEELAANTGIEVSKLVSGTRWGLLRKLMREGKVVKTGNKYEIQ